ncbi:MAG: methylated-DNA--[protein]-cysteine S-methyltransferase [Gemmatimonadota bacterium]
MTKVTCTYTDEDVLAFVAGDLAESDELAMGLHFGECGACRDQAAEFTALHRTLGTYSDDDIVRWHGFETPFGRTYAATTGTGLARVSWRETEPDAFVGGLEESFPGRPVIHERRGLEAAEHQLTEYFAGSRTRFDLPVDLAAVSEFDRRVLAVVRGIPFGGVLTYGDIARRIGSPSAARAVGNAVGRNPAPIVVPCHRVVRSDGTLGGYSGGGVEYKRRLLAIERVGDLFGQTT